ncbi:MAG: hypothetical protein IKV54_05065, partial [Clostridia bacterium]|nr:hypothetical protein [Clostridia bacterium]
KLITDAGFKRVLPVTTRPIRPGEAEGVTYHFISNEEFLRLREEGKFIESREYNTLYNGVPDVWRYATAKDSIELESGNYAAIVDTAALDALRSEYGKDLYSVYIDVPEPVRRSRCMGRGDFSLSEWERREEDDRRKYTEDILSEKIDLILENTDADKAFSDLISFLASEGCI